MAEARADVAEGLRGWLSDRGTDAEVEVRGRATVGLSQETWFVRVAADGGPVDAVLRLPTVASGPRAIHIQRAALQAVADADVAAPPLLWYDDGDDNAFGQPFIVMARVPGTVPVGWHTVPEPRRSALADQAIDVLARLHRIDLAGSPVAPLPPSPLRTLDGIRRRFDRLAPLPAEVSAALWWLGRHEPPPPAEEVIVHGDFRMGNFVVDGDRLTGVLDWELTSPGDPLFDLAWCFVPVWELPGVDEVGYVARYSDRTGREVDLARLHWHRVFCFVQLAYYALSGIRAFDRGHSDDLRLGAMRLQLPVTLDRMAATLVGDPLD